MPMLRHNLNCQVSPVEIYIYIYIYIYKHRELSDVRQRETLPLMSFYISNSEDSIPMYGDHALHTVDILHFIAL